MSSRVPLDGTNEYNSQYCALAERRLSVDPTIRSHRYRPGRHSDILTTWYLATGITVQGLRDLLCHDSTCFGIGAD
jgi:hypothetical protein